MIDLWWGNCSYYDSSDNYCWEKSEYFDDVEEWEVKDTWEALKNGTYWPSPNGRFFDYMGDPWDQWFDSDNSSTPSPWEDHYYEFYDWELIYSQWWGDCNEEWTEYCNEKSEYYNDMEDQYPWNEYNGWDDMWLALFNGTYWPSPNGRFFDYMGEPWDLWFDSDNSSTPSPWDDHYWETTSDPWDDHYYEFYDWGLIYSHWWRDWSNEKWEYYQDIIDQYPWDEYNGWDDAWLALFNGTYWPSPNGRFFDYMGEPWDLWFDSDDSSTPSPWEDHYYEYEYYWDDCYDPTYEFGHWFLEVIEEIVDLAADEIVSYGNDCSMCYEYDNWKRSNGDENETMQKRSEKNCSESNEVVQQQYTITTLESTVGNKTEVISKLQEENEKLKTAFEAMETQIASLQAVVQQCGN